MIVLDAKSVCVILIVIGFVLFFVGMKAGGGINDPAFALARYVAYLGFGLMLLSAVVAGLFDVT